MKRFERPPAAPRTLRALAYLLSYPSSEMCSQLQEVNAVLQAEQALSQSRLAELEHLIRQWTGAPVLTLEADYVALFDRGHATSLHLFEHVHGDSRERGPAMIDLIRTYEEAGLYLGPDELPDYLPVVLQFASTQPPQTAREFLGELAHILNALFNVLDQRGSGYAAIFGALLEIAGTQAHPVKVAAEAPLDASWQEPPVFNGCSTRGQQHPGAPQPIHILRKSGNAHVGAQL